MTLFVCVDVMCIEGFLVQLRHAGIPDGGGRCLCELERRKRQGAGRGVLNIFFGWHIMDL